jgi:hypothetical protein
VRAQALVALGSALSAGRDRSRPPLGRVPACADEVSADEAVPGSRSGTQILREQQFLRRWSYQTTDGKARIGAAEARTRDGERDAAARMMEKLGGRMGNLASALQHGEFMAHADVEKRGHDRFQVPR